MHNNYANEILKLPYSGKTILSYKKTKLRIAYNVENLVENETDDERLFWFRWIIGHHVSFICWVLINKYLNDNINLNKLNDNKIKLNSDRCLLLLQLLNCMYIYSSTVLEEVYNVTTRKFMNLYCNGFSGTWAKDYATLKNTISKYCKLEEKKTYNQNIKALFNESKIVHFAIANKLVKDRKSLLYKLNQSNPLTTVIKDSHKIYDFFFIVERDNHVTEENLIVSLKERLSIIKSDVEYNALFHADDKDSTLLLNNITTKKYIDNFVNIIDKVLLVY